MKMIIYILFCILLLTSCSKEEVSFQYTIRVYVADDEHNLIEGADITLKQLINGNTDYRYTYNKTEGYYEFTNLVDNGKYQIWVHKKGNIYKDKFEGASLDENKIISVNVTLDKF